MTNETLKKTCDRITWSDDPSDLQIATKMLLGILPTLDESDVSYLRSQLNSTMTWSDNPIKKSLVSNVLIAIEHWSS